MRGGVCGRPFVVEAMKGEPMSAPENVRTVGGAAELGVIDPVFVPTALVEVAEDAAARLDFERNGRENGAFSGKGVEEPEDGCHYFGGRLGRAFRPRGWQAARRDFWTSHAHLVDCGVRCG